MSIGSVSASLIQERAENATVALESIRCVRGSNHADVMITEAHAKCYEGLADRVSEVNLENPATVIAEAVKQAQERHDALGIKSDFPSRCEALGLQDFIEEWTEA